MPERPEGRDRGKGTGDGVGGGNERTMDDAMETCPGKTEFTLSTNGGGPAPIGPYTVHHIKHAIRPWISSSPFALLSLLLFILSVSLQSLLPRPVSPQQSPSFLGCPVAPLDHPSFLSFHFSQQVGRIVPGDTF